MLIILGCQDDEMDLIENLARNNGFNVAYAAAPLSFGPKKGEMDRVGPGVVATGFLLEGQYYVGAPEGVGYVAIEIMPGSPLLGGAILAHFDHHDAKNPNTRKPPEKSWEASSVGQFVSYLQNEHGLLWTIPDAWVEIAACDHALGAAFSGRVPGVDLSPGTPGYARLMERTHARYGHGLGIEEFTRLVEISVASLHNSPDWGGTRIVELDQLLMSVSVADLRDLPVDGPITPIGERYPSLAQYLPVVGSMVGKPYIVKIQAKHGPALRLGGFDGGNPEHQRILEVFSNNPKRFGVYPSDAPQPKNLYAFPARGMAGATIWPEAWEVADIIRSAPIITSCQTTVHDLRDDPRFKPGGKLRDAIETGMELVGSVTVAIPDGEVVQAEWVNPQTGSPMVTPVRRVKILSIVEEVSRVAWVLGLVSVFSGEGRVYEHLYRWGIYHKPTGVLLHWGAGGGVNVGKSLAAAFHEAEKTAHADELIALRSWGSDEDGAPPGITPRQDWWPVWPPVGSVKKPL